MTKLLRIAPEVGQTLRDGGPVVALETTLIAHGFPPGVGVEVGLEAEAAVRSEGAVPATIGVLDGAVVVGLSAEELARFGDAGPDARKAGPRDLAACVAQGSLGATTVGGTLAACRLAGIRFLGTGGIGGVHRGFAERPDVSADLVELARTPALVVSSGVKSLLDVPATAELLETLGVPVLGYRADELPLFYSAGGGPPVSARVESAAEAASIAGAHWELGGAALLLGRPADETVPNAEKLIEEALQAAGEQAIAGQDVTPFVLSFLQERSGGRALAVNRDLIVANARLAAEVAVAFAAS
ncbi:MAG: pseudouridine-5'-phosphate glycosidase [Actinomycetota bacterium]|nr:pseudouridine-5'-phosphate glycosidase [Actinomycetota bacterium]